LSVGTFAAVFLALAFFGVQSHRGDLKDPGVAAQLQKQQQHEEEFMKAPFQPEVAGPGGGAPTNPVAGKGLTVFTAQGCNACHGENGIGTAAAPKLTGVVSKYDATKLEAILRTPTEQMALGGMQAVDLKPDEMGALIAYLQSLK